MSPLLSALALGSSLQAAASGDSEVAVGSAPVGLGSFDEREQASAVLRLQPALVLGRKSLSSELQLSYSPRLLYRLPNLAGLERPLLLQEARLTYEANASSRHQFFATAEGTYGELDYTAVGDIFGTSQTGQVDVDIARMQRGFVSGGLVARTDARTEWSVTFGADYTTFSGASQSIDDASVAVDPGGSSEPDPEASPELEPADPATDLPASLLAEVNLGWSRRVSKQDTVGFRNQIAYQWFEGQGAFLLVGPEVGWRHAFAAGSHFDVAMGLAYVRLLDSGPALPALPESLPAPEATLPNSIATTGGVELAVDLYSKAGLAAAWQLSGALDWVFDPLAGASVPRAGGETQLSLRAGPRWAFTPNAGFYTQLRDIPQLAGDIDARFDQTLLRAEVPLQHTSRSGWQVRFGGRATFRGPRVGAADFTLSRRRELWAFFSVAARFPPGSGGTSGL